MKEENCRKKHFNNYGYDVLIIWESELSNINLLKNKIERFVNG